MTNTPVRAKVKTIKRISARVRDNEEEIKARASVIISTRLEDFDNIDIDPNTLQDGSLLVYEENEEKWKPKIDLFKQNMDAGEF